MKEVKVLDYMDNEIYEWIGYKLSPQIIMDIDHHGLFFLEYAEDTISASDKIKTHAITLPDGSSELLKTIGSQKVASMTVKDLALLFYELK